MIRASGVLEFDGKLSALAHDLKTGDLRNYAAAIKLEGGLNFASCPPTANLTEKRQLGQVNDLADAREKHFSFQPVSATALKQRF